MIQKFKNNQKIYNLVYVVSDISGSSMRGTFSSLKAMKRFTKDLTIDQYNTYTDNGSKKGILVVSSGSYDNIKEHFSTWNHEDFHSYTEEFGLFPNKNIMRSILAYINGILQMMKIFRNGKTQKLNVH
ncbi:hypothetical protein EI427_21590 [Flammeovirga pectinis]|uniref:Uncharacterized protein n=1 Tax=Flammeovirga pectinis TaxID=2494373 RepID=A0A3S9P9C9_9BACT|nr:hypothetical protein [Flammeovirga pectinis]AZQ64821.1 hypothetical protein EI427_21590 [Flammeovirga pectinis]